jgi:hypothetical protein
MTMDDPAVVFVFTKDHRVFFYGSWRIVQIEGKRCTPIEQHPTPDEGKH